MKKLKNKKVIIPYAVVIIGLIVLAIYFAGPLQRAFSEPEQIRNFVDQYGSLGPLVIVALQALQALIFFLPGPAFTIASGYLFGTFWGAVYSMVGSMIGSWALFMIGRIFGAPLVNKLVSKEDLKDFAVFFKEKGEMALFISRLSPLFIPHDIISFVVSQAPIKTRRFLVITFIGTIPQLLLFSIFGEKIAAGMSLVIITIISILIIALLIYHFKHPIKLSAIDKLINKTESAEIKIEGEITSSASYLSSKGRRRPK